LPILEHDGTVGFRPIGAMRQYERGGHGHFHHGLLMDLLGGELARDRQASSAARLRCAP